MWGNNIDRNYSENDLKNCHHHLEKESERRRKGEEKENKQTGALLDKFVKPAEEKMKDAKKMTMFTPLHYKKEKKHKRNECKSKCNRKGQKKPNSKI